MENTLSTEGDAKGWSAQLCEDFKRMAEKRIACQTYHKHPGEDWPVSEFTACQVPLMMGGEAEMLLAERGSFIGSKSDEQLWVREIRKLGAGGHQTSILSADWKATREIIAGPQFGRWYQENFFKYGREHFNLDRQIDYQLEEVDDTIRVINPAWRKLDGEVRKRVSKQTRRKARLLDLDLVGPLEVPKTERYMRASTELRTEIMEEEEIIEELKKQRRQTGKHITVAELPEEDRFLKLATPKLNAAVTHLCTELNASKNPLSGHRTAHGLQIGIRLRSLKIPSRSGVLDLDSKTERGQSLAVSVRQLGHACPSGKGLLVQLRRG